MSTSMISVGKATNHHPHGDIYKLEPPLAYHNLDGGIEYVLLVDDSDDAHMLMTTSEGGVRDWDRLDDILKDAGYEVPHD